MTNSTEILTLNNLHGVTITCDQTNHLHFIPTIINSEPMATRKNKSTESVIVRGIAASIQAMAYPDFSSLSTMLEQHGYKLIKQ